MAVKVVRRPELTLWEKIYLPQIAMGSETHRVLGKARLCGRDRISGSAQHFQYIGCWCL